MVKKQVLIMGVIIKAAYPKWFTIWDLKQNIHSHMSDLPSPAPNALLVMNAPPSPSPAKRCPAAAVVRSLESCTHSGSHALNPHKGPSPPFSGLHFIMLRLKWPLKSQIIFYLPFFSHLLLNVNEGKRFKFLLIKHFNWLRCNHNCKLATLYDRP